ncbi:unnamed protein product [Meganyctiphanes norvegica]|uniref:Uncharacterized protein n=1 Tax=Meganyctiphanes norvegica TaxID=48144 RepID=A0AAV2QET6_MEGNR
MSFLNTCSTLSNTEKLKRALKIGIYSTSVKLSAIPTIGFKVSSSPSNFLINILISESLLALKSLIRLVFRILMDNLCTLSALAIIGSTAAGCTVTATGFCTPGIILIASIKPAI